MMFFSRVLYLNVFQLTRLSCHTLTRPCIPPPHLIFPFSGYTFTQPVNVFPFNHWLTHSPLPYSHSPFTCLILAQCVLEEVASREAELGRLREKAHHLWEGQAAGKGFVHRVSQLSAQYLALSNLTKVILFPSCNPTTIHVQNRYLCVCACEILQHYEMSLTRLLSRSQVNTTEASVPPCCSLLFCFCDVM